MLFVNAILAGSFAVLAAAQSSVLGFTRVPNPVTAGHAQAITYMTNDTTTPVTIILRQGSANDLTNVSVLTTDAFGGQYIWTPETSLPNDSNYALEIIQGTQNNYFGPFTIQGGGFAATTSSSSTSAATTSSATLSSTGLAGVNGTITSSGTGIPLSTGMSSSLNSTTTASSNSTTLATSSFTPTPTNSATNSAGFQSTATAKPNSAVATGSSAIALVFGAVAAIIFC